MSIDITLSGVNVDAQSTNQAPKLPAWDVPSRMAFHVVYDVKNGPKRPAIRRPYKDTSRPANPRRDFQLHETRQINTAAVFESDTCFPRTPRRGRWAGSSPCLPSYIICQPLPQARK